VKVAFFGDIVGKPGRTALEAGIAYAKAMGADFVIVNGENASGGMGLTPETAKQILDLGVHAITTGNHVWSKKEMVEKISGLDRVIRPANYPQGVPGRGWCIVRSNSYRLAVVNLQGRVFMGGNDCPFLKADEVVGLIGADADAILIDFHAEATSEKAALGLYMDGKVAGVVGTHTHVQTADERILPLGTAYITDVGMCGPLNSVIGMDKDTVIPRFLNGMPTRFEVGNGQAVTNGLMMEFDHSTGRAKAISRINFMV
jgi:metallophosphoesterase (TIGR00282 family)